MKKRLFFAVVVLTAAISFLAGCTQIEREGRSPIPQNRPASWELNPYGDFAN